MTVREIPSLDFVVFDTCTLQEYYNDVHTILALPREHVVTYDYNERHVAEDARSDLDRFDPRKSRHRVLLAYIQDRALEKGTGSSDGAVLPDDSIVTFTRLGEVVAVRKVPGEGGQRYYLDIKLLNYPLDPGCTTAKRLIDGLRAQGHIPMATYVAKCRDTAAIALFNSTGVDEEAFSTIVNELGKAPSQFAKDTFWRITGIDSQAKSLVPMALDSKTSLKPAIRREGNRSSGYLNLSDQSTLFVHLQFHRATEYDEADYRNRRISVDASPTSSDADLIRRGFQSRAFGQETIALRTPTTSSLSAQDLRYQITTELHEKDERRDYPYGPQVDLNISYRKPLARSALAIITTVLASALFAWAAFSSSTATAVLIEGTTVSVCQRVGAVAVGVLLSLYAYYLWSDDIRLESVRRT